eukprot:699396-Pleurochrysis_carterae.AAC.1
MIVAVNKASREPTSSQEYAVERCGRGGATRCGAQASCGASGAREAQRGARDSIGARAGRV